MREKARNMEINIKTLQVTMGEFNADVDATTAPVVQEQVNVDTSNQVAVVELAGDVDASTTPIIQEQVLPLAQPGAKLLLDMTNVPYMSSAGLRLLLSLYRQVTSKEGQLVLVGVTEDIKDTMSITGFIEFFKICETLDAGLQALNVKLQVLPT